MLAQLDIHGSPPPVQPSTHFSLPLVIDESLVCLFKYWQQGIQEGMRHSQELYSLLQTYPLNDRTAAYVTANKQAALGLEVCITVSKYHYRVWLKLRSPTYD